MLQLLRSNGADGDLYESILHLRRPASLEEHLRRAVLLLANLDLVPELLLEPVHIGPHELVVTERMDLCFRGGSYVTPSEGEDGPTCEPTCCKAVGDDG